MIIEGALAGIFKGIAQPLIDKWFQEKEKREAALRELESEAMPAIIKALKFYEDKGVTFVIKVKPGAGEIEIPGYDPGVDKP